VGRHPHHQLLVGFHLNLIRVNLDALENLSHDCNTFHQTRLLQSSVLDDTDTFLYLQLIALLD